MKIIKFVKDKINNLKKIEILSVLILIAILYCVLMIGYSICKNIVEINKDHQSQIENQIEICQND